MSKLRNNSLQYDILQHLITITTHLLRYDYVSANRCYLEMAIGNAPWPIGVTMVGIHARPGREKVFSKEIAHVLNDEAQRKYIQGLKRLITRMQNYFTNAPSMCVEYHPSSLDTSMITSAATTSSDTTTSKEEEKRNSAAEETRASPDSERQGRRNTE